MKKEYLILIALILIVSAYLFFHQENKDHYTLPDIQKIDVSDVTGIILTKKQDQISFVKKGDHWLLTDKAYPADRAAVDSMLDTLKTLKLSALVSEQKDLKRYELDDENRIQVAVMNGQTVLFEFTMGKTAPTFNHTFVKLAGDTRVYHANGSFRSYFDKTIEEFRDKTVLRVKEKSITRFTIEKNGISKTLVSRESETDKDAVTISWQSEDEKPVDKEAASNLISAVSFLECENFPDAPARNELEQRSPLCRIRLENGKTTTLTLFKTDDPDNIIGISSMNTSVFSLSPHTAKEIVSAMDTLLGIAAKPEGKN